MNEHSSRNLQLTSEDVHLLTDDDTRICLCDVFAVT